MDRHVRIVGLLLVACGILLILLGLIVLFGFGGVGLMEARRGAPEQAPSLAFPLLGAVGGAVFAVFFVLSAPAILAGVGLLRRRRWARILGVLVSGAFLLWIPLGTAVGLYNLWVLLSKRTEALFRAEERPEWETN